MIEDEAPREPDHMSDVPISAPVDYQEWALVEMNGFSFTQRNGIVISNTPKPTDFMRIAKDRRA